MLTALACLCLSLPQSDTVEEPRLVVMIVVDQLVPQQLRRLESRLTGGFARFLNEGANFWRATIDYAATETGPGHATFATGRWPSKHGIVGNLYLDRASRTVVYCVGDPEAHALTGDGVSTVPGNVSPRNLLGPAFGDLLKARSPESKVIALSGKDRAAVLMGGHGADTALWWHRTAGGFTSSSYYGSELPEFVNIWNDLWRERARGWKWSLEVEGDLARLGTGPDEREGESSFFGRTLPRTLPSQDAGLPNGVLLSPLLDIFTLELATLALQTEELGRDDVLDYLGISLSGCDYLGHSYGPNSVEITDLLLRVDRQLELFFEDLDDELGKGRWVACLTSDHGILELPEALAARQVGARRVGPEEVAEMLAAVESLVASVFAPPAELGLRLYGLDFDFDEAAVRAAGIEPAELREVVAEAAAEAPFVAQAYTREQLLAIDADDPWLTLYQRSQRPERGVDVALRPSPWLLFQAPVGTSHGSPYLYDRAVPLAFLGPGIKPQHRYDPASPTDAVPTLLALLGLELPTDLDGRVLTLQ